MLNSGDATVNKMENPTSLLICSGMAPSYLPQASASKFTQCVLYLGFRVQLLSVLFLFLFFWVLVLFCFVVVFFVCFFAILYPKDPCL